MIVHVSGITWTPRSLSDLLLLLSFLLLTFGECQVHVSCAMIDSKSIGALSHRPIMLVGTPNPLANLVTRASKGLVEKLGEPWEII